MYPDPDKTVEQCENDDKDLTRATKNKRNNPRVFVDLPEFTGETVVPSAILQLKNWYVTLPTENPQKKGSPLSIYPPELDTYMNKRYFYGTPEGAVVFKAQAGGFSTSGSAYPRSELREMLDGKLAWWSGVKGVHTMTSTQAVTRLPAVKPHVVVNQIHDDDDDVIETRLTGKVLEVIHDSKHYGVLDPDYTLGEKFTMQIKVQNKAIEVYFNDLTKPKVKVPCSFTKGYFKIGCYTQTNTTKGDAPDSYAEVLVYKVDVKHA